MSTRFWGRTYNVEMLYDVIVVVLLKWVITFTGLIAESTGYATRFSTRLCRY